MCDQPGQGLKEGTMSANRIVRISLVTALIALTTSIAGTASQDRPGEVSGGSRQAIAGSWLETISPAAGPSFKALATYGEDGALVSSVQGSVITGPFPFPASYTASHGQWVHQGTRTFSTTAKQLVSDLNDGHLLFVTKLRQTVTLNRSGDAYRAVFRVVH
jgi:hypothetical protein